MIRVLSNLRAPARALSLRRDERGSALVIGAVALFVILAMMGGGLDLGRAYLTRSRLQQACDAGVLASRGALAQGWDTGAHAAADSMFDANFPADSYGATNLSHAFTVDEKKTVSGSASASVPTSLMRIFGFKVIPVSVTCGAQTQMANADIMFVLDTTDSMNAPAVAGDSKTKIAALKTAVLNFVNTIKANTADGSQVRYGFVPFGANVNVGGVLKPEWLANNWVYQSRQTFARYIPMSSTPDETVNGPTSALSGTSTATNIASTPANVESGLCPSTTPANTYTRTNNLVYGDTTFNPLTGNTERVFTETFTENGILYRIIKVGSDCVTQEIVYDNYVTGYQSTQIWWPADDPRRYQDWWHYGSISYDVSPLKNVGPDGYLTGTGLVTVPIGFERGVQAAPGGPRGDRVIPWRGCIEERQTVQAPIDATTGIPAGALDLDIDLMPDPSRPETLWGPSLPHLVFMKNRNDDFVYGGGHADPADMVGDNINIGDGSSDVQPYYQWDTVNKRPAYLQEGLDFDINGNGIIDPDEGDSKWAMCPAPARRLAEIDDVQTLSDYLNTISAHLVRITYHDIGMIWGARLLSPDGLFKAENRVSKNGGPITRHLILMTDGVIEPSLEVAGAYGLEPFNERRTPHGSLWTGNNDPTALGVLTSTVKGRFQAICKAARAKGFTVWVVAFGTTLDDNLTACASPNAAFQANNADELNKRFLDIAGRIASLRISE